MVYHRGPQWSTVKDINASQPALQGVRFSRSCDLRWHNRSFFKILCDFVFSQSVRSTRFPSQAGIVKLSLFWKILLAFGNWKNGLLFYKGCSWFLSDWNHTISTNSLLRTCISSFTVVDSVNFGRPKADYACVSAFFTYFVRTATSYTQLWLQNLWRELVNWDCFAAREFTPPKQQCRYGKGHLKRAACNSIFSFS